MLVLDRGNARVQLFDRAGRYLAQWKGPPFFSPQDVKVGPDGTVFVMEGGGTGHDQATGVVMLGRDGTVLGRIGRFGPYDGQFLDGHWLAVSRTGVLYTADFGGRRVQKFVRTGGGRHS